MKERGARPGGFGASLVPRQLPRVSVRSGAVPGAPRRAHSPPARHRRLEHRESGCGDKYLEENNPEPSRGWSRTGNAGEGLSGDKGVVKQSQISP